MLGEKDTSGTLIMFVSGEFCHPWDNSRWNYNYD